MFDLTSIRVNDFIKEIDLAIVWATENGWTIDQVPFVDKNKKCSPLGAWMLKDNLDPTFESKNITLIAASNDNFKKLNKHKKTNDMQLNSFLYGFYGCPNDSRLFDMNTSFYNIGLKYKGNTK